MTPARIARLNLTRSPFASAIGVLALGLALGLGGWMLGYYDRVFAGVERIEPGIDYVIGPKSSSLSILLDSLYLAGRNPDIFDYLLSETLREKLALRMLIPLAHFGQYRGLPVLGTEDSFLERPAELAPPRLQSGRWFRGPGREAVLGAEAARRSGLRVGDGLRPAYLQLEDDAGSYLVVGILEPSRLPRDRGIYVDIRHAWRYHALAIADGALRRVRGTQGVNAFLVALDPDQPGQAQALHDIVHVASNPDLIDVAAELAGLRAILGQGRAGLLGITALLWLLAAAATTLFFSERSESIKRDLGLYRALGYSRFQIARVLLWESLMLAACGLALGLALERMLAWCAGWFWNPPWLTAQAWPNATLLALSGAILAAALASILLPLLRLYRWSAHDALKGM